MNKIQIVALMSLILAALDCSSQKNMKCYESFNLLNNKGVNLKATCNGAFKVECFYKKGTISKIIAFRYVYGNIDEQGITTEKIGNQIYYCFDRSIMPGEEKLSLRIIPGKKSKWYDTLLVRGDTIYRKSLLYHGVKLSKCFRISKDTFKIVSYSFGFHSQKEAKRKSLRDFANLNNVAGSVYLTQMSFIYNETGANFFQYETNDPSHSSYEKGVSETRDQKYPPTLFWFYIYYRFMI